MDGPLQCIVPYVGSSLCRFAQSSVGLLYVNQALQCIVPCVGSHQVRLDRNQDEFSSRCVVFV